MTEFKITYLANNKPETKTQKGASAFGAECSFYHWAKHLDSPVRVVCVERVQL